VKLQQIIQYLILLRKNRNNVNSIHFEAATLYFNHTRTHETQATTSIKHKLLFEHRCIYF